jgi:PAS domain S-box-containing protein
VSDAAISLVTLEPTTPTDRQDLYVDRIGLSGQTALKGFLEAAPDAIVVVDTDGRIVIVNRLTEKLFGYSREELFGQPVEMLVPDRLREAHVADRTRYYAELRTRPMGAGVSSLTGRKRDGTEFPVEISLSPMQTGEGLLVTAAIRDITERKKVEAKFRTSWKLRPMPS